jgi:hypothetical protein
MHSLRSDEDSQVRYYPEATNTLSFFKDLTAPRTSHNNAFVESTVFLEFVGGPSELRIGAIHTFHHGFSRIFSHMTSDSQVDYQELLHRTIAKLRQAAEIEQHFMCMYLYGASSIQKRYVNNQRLSLSPPQLEITRRWANVLYGVARQEMEHLALVNNLLRSLGGAPYFGCPHVSTKPLASFHLGAHPVRRDTSVEVSPPNANAKAKKFCDSLTPIAYDFDLTMFDLDAARRWTCMESPNCHELSTYDDGAHFAEWCFTKKEAIGRASDTDEIGPGTIEDLYSDIEKLVKQLPSCAFVTDANAQVAIQQQYAIYVFPVTDQTSALQAIRLVTEQGEGITGFSTYPSHYRMFYDIVREWEKNGPMTAAWSLAKNPDGCQIQIEYTKRLFDLFNEAYETLLIMLTGLYATTKQNPTGYPYYAPALGSQAFAPYMTLVIRSLSEVLVQLKANEDGKSMPERVGPGFMISDTLNAQLREPYVDGHNGIAGSTLKPMFADIDEITRRVEVFCQKLRNLIDSEVTPPVVQPELSPWAQERLEYIHTNSQRIAANLRRIYQQNIFPILRTSGY